MSNIKNTSKKYFGAAIIAKNEQKYIKQCIKSLAPFCEQIVVVDTGSSDDTPTLASQLGAEVYFQLWNNSFSEARNFAISHIRTNWIISIDADEIIDPASFSYFIKNEFEDSSIVDESIGGITVTLNNYLSADLATSTQHRFTRIFRNSPRIFFQRKIHEQIISSLIAASLKTYNSGIIFNHFGYIEKNTEKLTRNKDLLEQNIESDYDIYHLASTEFAANNHNRALKLFTTITNSKTLDERQIYISKIRIAQILFQQEKYEETKKILNFTIFDMNWEGLRQSILAAVALVQNNFKLATELYNRPEINNSSLIRKETLEKAQNFLKLHNSKILY